jgi:hypothetical protein
VVLWILIALYRTVQLAFEILGTLHSVDFHRGFLALGFENLRSGKLI